MMGFFLLQNESAHRKRGGTCCPSRPHIIGRAWSSLIVNGKNGQPLRVLSPNSGILLNPDWFGTYWQDYVTQVYAHYTRQDLTVDTQASYGNVKGRVDFDTAGLNFGSGGAFPRPSAGDIFSCSTGPFATGQNGETNTIIPRLSAAFNRSTLLLTNNIPNGSHAPQYYQNPTTNVSLHECAIMDQTDYSTALCSDRTRSKLRRPRLCLPI